MRLRILGCAGGSAPETRLSSYLIDDRLVIDAGALTTGLDLDAQRAVESVVLTHGHLDHVWSLPLFLANRFGGATKTCHIHASGYTLDTIRTHLFNDRIWPDFTAATIEDRPLVAFHAIEPGSTREVLDGYTATPIPMNHTVPCQAYRIEHGGRSVIVCGDTSTTVAVWEAANDAGDLAGILIECSFPNALRELATVSGHLTPEMLLADLKKLKREVPVHVMHLKPGYESDIHAQLAGQDARIHLVDHDEVLNFGA